MELTVDAFHALARSSPWRWDSLQLRHRGEMHPDGVEAWIVRPGWMLVKAAGREDQLVREQLREPVVVHFSAEADFVAPPPPEPRWAVDVAPAYRPDGLVADRPAGPFINFDDPMYESYTWVAMLDPQELSHHVAVEDLRAVDLRGRETWRATVRALDGYEARCPDCCDLLAGGASKGVDHEVAIDVQTGVLVSLRALGGTRDWWLENEIVAVDDTVVLPT